jgi:hypothetical protein
MWTKRGKEEVEKEEGEKKIAMHWKLKIEELEEEKNHGCRQVLQLKKKKRRKNRYDKLKI